MRHLPNLICLLRIALVWPVVQAIERGAVQWALALFCLAAISDALDGYLAKRFHWTSEIGRWLDPVADKILLVAVFLTCTWQGWVPVWLAAAVVARDVMIAAGALIFRVWFGALNGYPTVVSKINTALQIAVIVVAMLQTASGISIDSIVTMLALATGVTTVWSGIDYVARFVRRAWALTASRG